MSTFMYSFLLFINISKEKVLYSISNMSALLSLAMEHENLSFHLLQKIFMSVKEKLICTVY